MTVPRTVKIAAAAPLAWMLLTLLSTSNLAWAGGGRLELTVVDKDTGKPIACRMHLTNQMGRPQRIKRYPSWNDHFVFDGHVMLNLPKGNYAFELEHGPEYVTRSGHFTITDFADDTKQIDLKRFVDMSSFGWWSGDLYATRPIREIELLMRAEDLHVVPVLTWNSAKNTWAGKTSPADVLVRFDSDRYYQLMGGAVTWPGGELLLLNLPKPLPLREDSSEYPSPVESVAAARKHPGAWIDLSRPYWWDLPMLVALGQVDSIEIAHGEMGRANSTAGEAHGKARDKTRYPDPWGNAQWTQAIYFHLLNCGLRIPPSAGSGSGIGPNPLGYNRMYVHVDSAFDYQRWWEGLRAGRVTVTNGPLLRPTVDGRLPGHVFEADTGPLELEIGLTLSTREPISYLDLVKDGALERSIPFDEYRKGGRLPKVRFDRSGWFLIRAVTDLPKTYRFAMTGPYYVQIGGQPRISRRAVQFFIDWLEERIRHLASIQDPTQRDSVLRYHRQARDFWEKLLSRANAD